MAIQKDNLGDPGKLRITKHGDQLRAQVLLNLVVGEERDSDIIAALNELDKEDRQAALKNAIRTGWDGLVPIKFDHSEIVNELRGLHAQGARTYTLLEQLRAPIEWIEQQFILLHQYLEDKFKRIGRVSMGSPFELQEEVPIEEDRATQEQQEKRRANVRKQGWGTKK